MPTIVSQCKNVSLWKDLGLSFCANLVALLKTMSKFYLVVSDIKALNVGVSDGGQRHKEQLAQIRLKGSKKKTKVVSSHQSKSDEQDGLQVNTIWKETLEFDLDKEELRHTDILEIKILQPRSIIPDRLLGQGSIPLEALVIGKEKLKTFKVNLSDGNNYQEESTFICNLEYKCPEERRVAKETVIGTMAVPRGTGEEEETLEHKTSMIRSLLVRGHQAMQDKPLDFQIRVKVIEARQLEGGDINPVIKVSIGNETQQTRVLRMTNRPYYNQTFFFDFTSTTFQDLFDKQIKFEAFNSKRLRSDALIGFYKCGVGAIYGLKDHILLRKWIMLAEPEESGTIFQGGKVSGKSREPSGVGGVPAGFVKVSVVVLEAGLRNTNVSHDSLQDFSKDSAEDDIETNLLQLPGVSLTPAVFTLKVYTAEDIPQMDENHLLQKAKQLADPYCVFSFSGKQVKSTIQYSSTSPKFNQQLSVPFKFPSMCDKLKIQLIDWDRITAHDHIGTICLPLPSISGDGSSGFLPTFGPCYINLYGSPREYTDLPDKYDELNKGEGEGAAYRGRVLVELETKLNEECESGPEAINYTDIIKAQPYKKRQKFCLLVGFLEATMLAVEYSHVEFEVSIGNYGNKFDDSVTLYQSTTPPINPVFDGNKYYYIPWGNSKPYIRIDCQWEDITFRLRTLNKLLKICARLEQSIETLKKKRSGNDYDEVASQALAQLIKDCSPLPQQDPKKCMLTHLDLKLRIKREAVLMSIAEECKQLKDGKDHIERMEDFLRRIQNIAEEPQNSIPDVIIWMLKGGSDRIAYCRIPAYKLLYAAEEDERGEHCGKIIDINLKYPGKKRKTHESKFPALLRVMMWFGSEEHRRGSDEFEKTGGELLFYAEKYKNKGWFGKSSFFDASGKIPLSDESFVFPTGWEFDSEDWKVLQELGTQYTQDIRPKPIMEGVYENEHRLLQGGKWQKNENMPWTDVYGEVLLDKQGNPVNEKKDIKPPQGWRWESKDGWEKDLERAVDHDGWEYTDETSFGLTNYEPAEKTSHFCRRRRWTNKRIYGSGHEAGLTSWAHDPQKAKEGLEYAVSFRARFHIKSKDRRQRLYRKLKRNNPKAPEPVFMTVKNEGQSVEIPPAVFLHFEKPHFCQLRAYLYQGRNLLPSDPDGLADPYIHISFGTRSVQSKTISKKLNPTWNQMFVLDNVPMYGLHHQVTENPPDVLMELFDRDPVGKHEFLGRAQAEPIIFLPNEKPDSEHKTKLSWHKVCKGLGHCGDVLAAFELFVDADKSPPPPVLTSTDEDGSLPIPPHICRVQKHVVEILCWGLRNLARYRFMSIKSPSIQVEIGSEVKETSVIENMKKNPNFQDRRLLCFNVDLPSDDIYIPPITIQLKSNSSYGHPVVGVCVIDNIKKYRPKEQPVVDKKTSDSQRSSSHSIEMEEEPQTAPTVHCHDSYDWWPKYLSSGGGGEDWKRGANETQKNGNSENKDEHYDRIKIYPYELEEEFDYFQDFIKTFYLRRGKIESYDEYDEDSVVGEFKGNLAIYRAPEDTKEQPSPKVFSEEKLGHIKPEPCCIRVYIVRAYALSPRDLNGLADPYLVVSLGNETFDDKKDCAADTLEVDFGKMFEFHAEIPVVKDLKIKVMDYDDFTSSDLIGETVVDLESRLFTLRHAMVGLPDTYNLCGPNKWRLGDDYKPTTILKNYCELQGWDPPSFPKDNKVLILKPRGEEESHFLSTYEGNGTVSEHCGEWRERLALHVLKKHECIKMVPEHVETRVLTNRLYPGFPQGKLEMFVDIFPQRWGLPGPKLDISPPKPRKYELRVIVWNTKDVKPQETNFLGEEMSDIFVKCNLVGTDDIQKTDVHYRSLNGDGMFNWRMVFPFAYIEAYGKVVVEKKAHFWSRRKHQDKLEPQLSIQVWDNDIFSRNDFIGSVSLNLLKLPEPYGSAREITSYKLDNVQRRTQSLFKRGSVRGWWPIHGDKNSSRSKEDKKKKKKEKGKKKSSDEDRLKGKVELTIQILESEEAEANPVGKGLEEPNRNPHLEKPQRPATSFLWLTNPWKSFRHIFLKHYKWYIILSIIIVLIILLLALFIYSAPGYTVKKLFKA